MAKMASHWAAFQAWGERRREAKFQGENPRQFESRRFKDWQGWQGSWSEKGWRQNGWAEGRCNRQGWAEKPAEMQAWAERQLGRQAGRQDERRPDSRQSWQQKQPEWRLPDRKAEWPPSRRVHFAADEFEEWLLEVEPRGSLLVYLEVLGDNFDAVAQVESLYVLPPHGPLSEEFFVDVGIFNEKHRHLFRKFYGTPAPKKAGRLRPGKGRGVPPAEVPKVPFKRSVELWLMQLDPDGLLLKHARRIEAWSKDVDAIEKFYLKKGEGFQRWREEFFADFGITSRRDQQKFSDYYDEGEPPTSPFAKWLLAMDPQGRLLCYKERVEENYDGVQELEDLYVTESRGRRYLDKQFFEDMGIEDELHKELMLEWYFSMSLPGPALKSKPQEPKRTSLESWLRAVDPEGGLLRYLPELEDNYDSLEEVQELYVLRDENGRRSFDRQFFEDVGIDDEEHKSLLLRYFDGGGHFWKWLKSLDGGEGKLLCYEKGLEENYDSPEQLLELYSTTPGDFFEDMEVVDLAHKAIFTRAIVDERKAPQVHRVPVPEPVCHLNWRMQLRPKPFTEWLLRIDPYGELGIYRERLERSYEGEKEVEQAYIGADGRLSEDFFTDLGVRDEEHRRLFRTALERPKKEQVKDDPRLAAFLAWLRKVDATGSLDGYARVLAEAYDEPEQIRYLYMANGQLSPDFFSDVGVRDEEHKMRFLAFFGPEEELSELAEDELALRTRGDPMEHPEPTLAELDLGRRSEPFRKWLLSMDIKGRLLRYCKHAEENFDSVAQVEELYLEPRRDGGVRVSEDFFEDMNMRDLQHVALVRAHYARRPEVVDLTLDD